MSDLKIFYSEIKEILTTARRKAYVAVNSAMVEAYWLIGKRIVEEEQNGKNRAGYGEYLIRELSKELSSELGKGFSYANLWNFRQFYLTFPSQEKLYALRRELTWTHYRMIMRVENTKAREYYIKEAVQQHWNTRQLKRNIKSLYYERLLTTKENQNTLQEKRTSEKNQTKDFIKDPYILEFLGLPEKPFPKENSIEISIIENLKDFLLEMGNEFSFVGRQFRISTETKHFYINLVFYNYLLKCFVLIDLKTTELTHQDKENEQLFASKYRLVLPSEEELAAELERERRLIEEQGH